MLMRFSKFDKESSGQDNKTNYEPNANPVLSANSIHIIP
jgi:hypothetical protein